MKENEKEFITEDQKAFKPIYENPIILDFSGCKHTHDIHEILKEKFGLPDYYGMNWDALWDCLRFLWIDGEKIHAKLFGLNLLSDDLIDYCGAMIEVFEDVNEYTPNFTFEIVS